MVTNMQRLSGKKSDPRICRGKFNGPLENLWIRFLDPYVSRGQHEIKVYIQFGVSQDIVLHNIIWLDVIKRLKPKKVKENRIK